jgi:hypothetical protein
MKSQIDNDERRHTRLLCITIQQPKVGRKPGCPITRRSSVWAPFPGTSDAHS